MSQADPQNHDLLPDNAVQPGRFAPPFCQVLAMEGIASLGANLEEIFASMLAGRSGIRPDPEDGGFPRALLPPEILSSLLPSRRSGGRDKAFGMALACASGALAKASEFSDWLPGELGLVLSSAKGEMEDFFLAAAGKPSPGRFLLGAMARQIAEALGIAGPVQAVSNACASGLVALAQGARMLARGWAKAVLVLGVDTASGFVQEGFASLRALSPSPCRPFDRHRQGLNLGEGAAAMLLSLAEPGEAGYAPSLVGWAVSNDANHMTGPSRDGAGLRRVIEQALRRAGMAPDMIGLLNAHGTGTEYNDEMEAKAIHAVFGPYQPAVVSFKGYLGHSLGAAGVLEAALCLKALARGLAPASLGYAAHGVSSPIRVLNRQAQLPGLEAVLTLKSGFGGVNAAAVFAGRTANGL